jgi:hypothetical protein
LPAGIVSAAVMVTSVMLSEAKFEQVSAAADPPPAAIAVSPTLESKNSKFKRFTAISSFGPRT